MVKLLKFDPKKNTMGKHVGMEGELILKGKKNLQITLGL